MVQVNENIAGTAVQTVLGINKGVATVLILDGNSEMGVRSNLCYSI